MGSLKKRKKKKRQPCGSHIAGKKKTFSEADWEFLLFSFFLSLNDDRQIEPLILWSLICTNNFMRHWLIDFNFTRSLPARNDHFSVGFEFLSSPKRASSIRGSYAPLIPNVIKHGRCRPRRSVGARGIESLTLRITGAENFGTSRWRSRD